MPTVVLLLRGHHPTVWGLRAFEGLPERFAVRLRYGQPHYSLEGLGSNRCPFAPSAIAYPAEPWPLS